MKLINKFPTWHFLRDYHTGEVTFLTQYKCRNNKKQQLLPVNTSGKSPHKEKKNQNHA